MANRREELIAQLLFEREDRKLCAELRKQNHRVIQPGGITYLPPTPWQKHQDDVVGMDEPDATSR